MRDGTLDCFLVNPKNVASQAPRTQKVEMATSPSDLVLQKNHASQPSQQCKRPNAPASEEAQKHKASRESKTCCRGNPHTNAPKAKDRVQTFLRAFEALAKPPLFHGKPIQGRRLVCFGPTLWGRDVSRKIDELPTAFRKWCTEHGFVNYNSVTASVYTLATDHLPWRTIDASILEDPEVMIISFALRKEHRTKKLADVEFHWKNTKGGSHDSGLCEMRHESTLRFNARKHAKRSCRHSIRKALYPRIDVEMRRVRKS